MSQNPIYSSFVLRSGGKYHRSDAEAPDITAGRHDQQPDLIQTGQEGVEIVEDAAIKLQSE